SAVPSSSWLPPSSPTSTLPADAHDRLDDCAPRNSSQDDHGYGRRGITNEERGALEQTLLGLDTAGLGRGHALQLEASRSHATTSSGGGASWAGHELNACLASASLST